MCVAIIIDTVLLLSVHHQNKPFCFPSLQDGVCHFKSSKVGATDGGFVDVPHGEEDKLKEVVATIGPVSIAIDASHPSFQLYKSGMYTQPHTQPVQRFKRPVYGALSNCQCQYMNKVLTEYTSQIINITKIG